MENYRIDKKLGKNKMNLSEYLKKILKDTKTKCEARLDFDLILDDKCQVNKKGKQKVHFEVILIK